MDPRDVIIAPVVSEKSYGLHGRVGHRLRLGTSVRAL